MSSRTKEREEEDDDRKSVLDRYKLEPRQRKDHRKTFGTTRDANERVSEGASESREPKKWNMSDVGLMPRKMDINEEPLSTVTSTHAEGGSYS